MFLHGLKINISVNLAILLGIAMVLIDFVMVIAVQNILLRSEISKGDLLISAIETHLVMSLESPNAVFHDQVDTLLSASGFSCVMILDTKMNPTHVRGTRCALQKEISDLSSEAIRLKKKMVRTLGTIWGVFWKQRQYMILSAPLFRDSAIVGGAGILVPLRGIYVALRHAQHILFIYALINMIVLTLIGLRQLSKVTIKPVHRLLRRAEDYQEETEFFFLTEKEDNEFSQLSKALNRMLNRISDDKKKLCLTVQSLEKANSDLKQAQKDVIRAEKLASVGQLTAGIAHEIGNPITIIVGYLELLRREDLSDEEKKEFIVRAEDEVKRINMIIRQLLDFSRPSMEPPKPISVHELIENVMDVLKFQPMMSGICPRLSLFAEKDTIVANSNQLWQVFLNLAMNAADAISSIENKSDGTLVISSETVPHHEESGSPRVLKLSFADNGCGIPEEDIGNIFDPFYTTKEPGKGTGLGLSVSFMIIESIGGKIKAASEPGKGTTMTLYLPIS